MQKKNKILFRRSESPRARLVGSGPVTHADGCRKGRSLIARVGRVTPTVRSTGHAFGWRLARPATP